MLQLEVLVLKLVTVDRLATGAVSGGEITTLEKRWNKLSCQYKLNLPNFKLQLSFGTKLPSHDLGLQTVNRDQKLDSRLNQ